LWTIKPAYSAPADGAPGFNILHPLVLVIEL
jgi:hypothetical protein